MDKGYSHFIEDNRGAHIKYYTSLDDDFKVDEVYATWNKKYTLRGYHGSKKQRKKIKVLNGSVRLILIDLNDDLIKIYDKVDNTKDPIFVDLNCFVGYLSLEDDTIVSYVVSGNFSPEYELTYSPLTVPDLWNNEEINVETDTINISEKDSNALPLEELSNMKIEFEEQF